MRAVVFTCRRDAGKARLATRTIPAGWGVVWIVDEADADLELPDGVVLKVAPFKRGANLYGPKACLGIASVLAREAQAHGRVAKVDSDCLLVHPDFLLDGELAGVRHNRRQGAVFGLAYGMGRKAAQNALGGILEAIAGGSRLEGEDREITSRAGFADGILGPEAVWESRHSGRLPPAGVVAIHCGGPAAASREGNQIEREMKRLGDALGLWRR